MYYIYHTDPGHGWLEVTTVDLDNVSLKPSDFSAYTYRQGNTLYLEEDVDMPVFIAAWRAVKGDKVGDNFPLKEVYSSYSFIRNLRSVAA
jgi:hypothetical protein